MVVNLHVLNMKLRNLRKFLIGN